MINEANLSAVYDEKSFGGSKVAAPRTRKREQTERPIKGAGRQRAAPSYTWRVERKVERKERGGWERAMERGRVRGLRKSVFDID